MWFFYTAQQMTVLANQRIYPVKKRKEPKESKFPLYDQGEIPVVIVMEEPMPPSYMHMFRQVKAEDYPEFKRKVMYIYGNGFAAEKKLHQWDEFIEDEPHAE